MRPLTLAESAAFLRMSKSTLYQRKDIPRYRRPGSRVMLFDQEELETWLKQGRIGGQDETHIEGTATAELSEVGAGVVDISFKPVYHRHARYR